MIDLDILLQDLGQKMSYTKSGEGNPSLTGIHFDSRKITQGMLFCAMPGGQTDGHRFIPQVLERGAAAIVGEQERPDTIPASVPYIRVTDGREALGHLAAAWHGHPSRRMTVIGVTGTDGKTTTVNLIQSILAAAGKRTGMISTVNALIGDRYLDTGLHVTTPDALQVQSLLAQMAQANIEIVILESTSHGLAQHRVTGVDYDVAVVTNITHEHLDYHGSWEQYCADKARLFWMLTSSACKPGVPKVAVINADDASFDHLQPIPADRQIVYGLDQPAEITAQDLAVVEGVDGPERSMTLVTPQGTLLLHSALVEHFNTYNILAAASTALAVGISPEIIQRGIAEMRGVIGRMERIDEGQNFTAIVDFAHTPNALLRALESLRPQTSGRLIVIFGSAGLRDVYKRGMMGRVAGELADVSVITAEDPRTEDLDGILAEIARGCESKGAKEGEGKGRRYYRVADRSEAIAFAVNLAQAGDVVVTCGKAHEKSMCFGMVEYPWNEHQALRAALLARLGRPGEVKAPWLPTSSRPQPEQEKGTDHG